MQTLAQLVLIKFNSSKFFIWLKRLYNELAHNCQFRAFELGNHRFMLITLWTILTPFDLKIYIDNWLALQSALLVIYVPRVKKLNIPYISKTNYNRLNMLSKIARDVYFPSWQFLLGSGAGKKKILYLFMFVKVSLNQLLCWIVQRFFRFGSR